MTLRGTAVAFMAACTIPAAVAHAQDRRHVVEPRVPPICRALDAALTAAKGVDGDDAPADTRRIQDAIDRCQAGTGVELRAVDGHNAFVAAPLELRPGLTLVVAAGATLSLRREIRAITTSPRGRAAASIATVMAAGR